MELWNKLSTEKKAFYIFLIIHLIVWTGIGLIRTVLPTDALEGIYWGSFLDFGTPKHPPFFGWIAYFVYSIFKSDFSIYFISQLFILGGFVYIYKLAKCILDENRAMLSVVILEGCWCYSYITGYYGFNPDVIMLFMLPAISYYFYQCMKFNRTIDWVKLGLFVGVGFLNKYQTALLIIPMFIWALAFKRETFKNKYFYISITIAFLIFLPHILWLIKYDFFPFMYFQGELSTDSLLNHITAPLKFAIMQISVIAGVLVIYTALKIQQKSPYKLNTDFNTKIVWFLLLLGLTSFAIHVSMGLLEGGTMRPRWGYEFWFLLGITLFYFFPCTIDKKAYMFTIKCAYFVMFITFLSIGTLLVVEKNYRSRYPVNTVFSDLQNIWAKHYNTPIKYMSGYIEWTLPLTIYTNSHPHILLDTYGYPDPWTDYDDMKKSGVMVIDRTVEKLLTQAQNTIPYFDITKCIKPTEYKFMLTNALGQSREYTIYYTIIPPDIEN